jgi:hypothetical protein
MVGMTERKRLSTRGRVIAAACSVGIAVTLAGVMAATDSSADATSTPGTNDAGLSSPSASSSGSSATPFTPSSQTPTQTIPTQLPTFQPHTRSGGS